MSTTLTAKEIIEALEEARAAMNKQEPTEIVLCCDHCFLYKKVWRYVRTAPVEPKLCFICTGKIIFPFELKSTPKKARPPRAHKVEYSK